MAARNRPQAAAVAPPQPAIPTQQRILGLDVVQLKSLKDLSLDFTQSPLTAIMGSNCSGKTTVLHAIACAYKPPNTNSPNYRFSLFFRPNTDALWNDSDFTVRYSQRVGQAAYPTLSQRYAKATDRWTPRYDNRPERYSRFISIGESVPDIETLNLTSMIHYTKLVNDDAVGIAVRDAGGQILNRQYDTLYKVTYAYGRKLSIGVGTPTVTYSGLSMSSGEQRVFRILDAVFRAPNYGLILIDEIDLFLHQDALQRLLTKLNDHCAEKSKQLIFTTHFPPIAELYKKMSIYTLNRVPAKTVVWRGYSYEAMRHITGAQERPISCYVEDDVAEQIVARIATELEIRRFVQIGRYGPAGNAFNLCAGLYLSNIPTLNTLAVLDGDVYGTPEERRARSKLAITGNLEVHERQRRALMRLVRTLCPTKNAQQQPLAPEQMLHGMLRGLDVAAVPANMLELFNIAQGIVNVPEKHQFVNLIIEDTGEPRQIALSKIVDLASQSTDWERYTRVVRGWLRSRKDALNL